MARRKGRMCRVLFAAATAVVLVMLPAAAAKASGPTVTGAGSTWVQIALDQWRADAARQGLNINYQGVGSTAGRQFYVIGQVDFAASEIPFLPDEVRQLKSIHRSYQYLPDVAGGTAIMYNLKDASGHQVTNLQLSAATIAKIFTGRITSWNDPAIKGDNPHLVIPSGTRFTPVIRSDGSGTSAKLADYLAHLAPSTWGPFARQYHVTLPVQFWPNIPHSVAVRGSDGMANYISNPSVGLGSIGYVEAGYVYEHSLTPAFIRNASGHYAAPTSTNVAVALKHATLNPDLTQNLGGVYAAPEANAYPLASYSYLITPTSGLDPAKGAVLGKWIIYIACAGQQEAAPLGYSPLSPNLVQDVFAAVRRIPGAPNPPALTPQACPNPTITGQGTGGSPQQGPTTNPQGGGSTTTNANTTTTTNTHTKTKGGKHVATANPGSLTDPAALGVTVTPMSDSARQASFDAALHEIASLSPTSAGPQLLAALLLVALVAAPLVVGRVRRPARVRIPRRAAR
jgi:phosphate transport system substrate-binding protein